jgi:hypothetical protein
LSAVAAASFSPRASGLLITYAGERGGKGRTVKVVSLSLYLSGPLGEILIDAEPEDEYRSASSSSMRVLDALEHLADWPYMLFVVTQLFDHPAVPYFFSLFRPIVCSDERNHNILYASSFSLRRPSSPFIPPLADKVDCAQMNKQTEINPISHRGRAGQLSLPHSSATNCISDQQTQSLVNKSSGSKLHRSIPYKKIECQSLLISNNAINKTGLIQNHRTLKLKYASHIIHFHLVQYYTGCPKSPDAVWRGYPWEYKNGIGAKRCVSSLVLTGFFLNAEYIFVS